MAPAPAIIISHALSPLTHHPLHNNITSTVISLESATTLKNRVWHETIKVALDQSSWLTPLQHGSKSNYCITHLCSYQYYMTAGAVSVTKHISDACRVSGCVRMAHLGMCYRWSTAGSSYIPPLGFHCPYRCTTGRWSSWRSCCRRSWESCPSLRGHPHKQTDTNTYSYGSLMGNNGLHFFANSI